MSHPEICSTDSEYGSRILDGKSRGLHHLSFIPRNRHGASPLGRSLWVYCEDLNGRARCWFLSSSTKCSCKTCSHIRLTLSFQQLPRRAILHQSISTELDESICQQTPETTDTGQQRSSPVCPPPHFLSSSSSALSAEVGRLLVYCFRAAATPGGGCSCGNSAFTVLVEVVVVVDGVDIFYGRRGLDTILLYSSSIAVVSCVQRNKPELE